MANFETVEVNTDLLIIGGGMAACGAATEAACWAKKNGLDYMGFEPEKKNANVFS